MRPSPLLVFLTFLCASLLASAFAESPSRADDASSGLTPSDGSSFSLEPPDPLPLITWRELTDHPGRYTNKRARIVLQLQARVPTWNPYLTRFGTRDFKAFQFWGDEQRLWVLGDFQTPAVRLFARRESLAGSMLESSQPYARFELTIVVRDVFLDQPWAEIESAFSLPERVSEGTLIHASRATEFIESKSWKLAENELDQALIGALPEEAKRELERLREECLEMTAPKGKLDSKPAPILRGKPRSVPPKD
jgi:hypothetical protein